MRKLASIQKIVSVEAIKDADAIEKATVLGWQLVVKKGEFKVGDLCVYCEIDSLFPDKPMFEFLKPRGMRIRTVKLRGQVSQGICFPLTILPENFEIEFGKDCTEALEITKYEMPIPECLLGKVKGGFPSIIPKTSETRIQVMPEILVENKEKQFVVTEKLDGSSITIFVNNNEFGVCSRNLELLPDENNVCWKLAKELDMENKLRSLKGQYAFQGEIVGPGIQGNKYKLNSQKVFFYNIFDINSYEYFSDDAMRKMLDELNLQAVPLIDNAFTLKSTVEELVGFSKRKSILHPEIWAEGIVVRSKDEIRNSPNKHTQKDRLSFKVINPEFLLKYGE